MCEAISVLTALFGLPVVADQGFLRGDAEQAGPVDSVVVAQLAVVGDVDVTSADLTQRLQLQRRDPLLLEHQQRDSAERGKTRNDRKDKLVNEYFTRKAGIDATNTCCSSDGELLHSWMS